MINESAKAPTIPNLLSSSVHAFGDQLAIIEAGARLTYNELDAASKSVAAGLLAIGAGKGTRIAILAPNGAEFMNLFLACTRIGAVAIPISTLSAPGEIAYVLRHSDAQILLAVRHYLETDYAGVLTRALPSLANARHRAIRCSEAPYLRSVWFDEQDDLAWAGTFAALSALGTDDAGLDNAMLAAIEAEVAPSDDAVIIYTSGSTAKPKAVLHVQATLARHAPVLADLHCIRQNERILTMLPLFWVGGLGFALEALVKGACLVFPERPSPPSVTDAIIKYDVERVHAWPALRKPILDLLDKQGKDPGNIRGLGPPRKADGSLLDPTLMSNSLGMTETFGPHSGWVADDPLPEHRRGSFGVGAGGIEHRVVDLESGVEVAPGASGELWLRGGQLMKEYYKTERSETFTPDGFYRTQDLVRIEPDGHLYFEGRTGDMLKSRGANISRLEVETTLRSLPDVEEVVVCGIPDDGLDERVVAAVIPAAGTSPSESSLKAALRDLLSSYKIPRNIIFITRDDLIWTASGKIRVQEMGKLIAARLSGATTPQ